MTSEVLSTLALIVNPVLVGILGWMLNRWIVRLEKIIEQYGKNQTECQLSLAKVYRTKTEAETDSTRQWEKIDGHGERLTRIETMLKVER